MIQSLKTTPIDNSSTPLRSAQHLCRAPNQNRTRNGTIPQDKRIGTDSNVGGQANITEDDGAGIQPTRRPDLWIARVLAADGDVLVNSASRSNGHALTDYDAGRMREKNIRGNLCVGRYAAAITIEDSIARHLGCYSHAMPRKPHHAIDVMGQSPRRTQPYFDDPQGAIHEHQLRLATLEAADIGSPHSAPKYTSAP